MLTCAHSDDASHYNDAPHSLRCDSESDTLFAASALTGAGPEGCSWPQTVPLRQPPPPPMAGPPGHRENATATPAAATVGERSANHGEIRRSEADRRLKLATPNRYRFLVRFKRKSPSFDGLSFIVSYSLDGLTRPQHVLITQPTRGTQPLRHLSQQRRHLLPPSPVFFFPYFFSFFLGGVGGLGCFYKEDANEALQPNIYEG